MTAPETTTQKVDITRTVNAPAAVVYAALTQRNNVVLWFSDDAHLRARVNAPYQLVWNAGYHVQGEFTALEENQQVSYTWRDNLGEHTSQVDITLTEKDDLTELKLVHSAIAGEETRAHYEKEWQNVLDNLVSVLETGADLRILNRVIIGIFPGAVPENTREELGLEQGDGAQVASLLDGFGAQKAGLQVNDTILAMDGTSVTRQNPMFMLVQDKKPGDDVEVTFYRDGEKHTATMTLSGYPVPEIPESFKATAEKLHTAYKEVFTDLKALFDGVDAAQAATKPTENEWSANEVLAHLILAERDMQDWLVGHISGRHKRAFNSNVHVRVDSIVATYETTEALLKALKVAMKESVYIMANRPDTDFEVAHRWQTAFQGDGNIRHIQSHFPQIEEALAAAKA